MVSVNGSRLNTIPSKFLANSLLLSAVTGCTHNNKSGTLTNLIYLIYSGKNVFSITSVIITRA